MARVITLPGLTHGISWLSAPNVCLPLTCQSMAFFLPRLRTGMITVSSSSLPAGSAL